MTGRLHRPVGHSLPELLVGLFLAGLVGAVVVALLGSSTRAVSELTLRSELAETRRTVSALLDEELSVGVFGRDWVLENDVALRLRAFRGYGRTCPFGATAPGLGAGALSGSTSVVAAWQGIRAPDPERDSVLVLTAQGTWEPVDLVRVEASGPPETGAGGGVDPCPLLPGEGWARWELGEATGVPLLLRYFETGRYSLEDRAFRYRQGMGGRQPLTPEVVEPASGFRPGPASSVEVELHLGAQVDRWSLRGDPAGPRGRPLSPSAAPPGGGGDADGSGSRDR